MTFMEFSPRQPSPANAEGPALRKSKADAAQRRADVGRKNALIY
jgi:hypothetical protein